MQKRVNGRRQFLTASGAWLLTGGLNPVLSELAYAKGSQLANEFHFGVIPKTKELIPAIGMGSWITFNVGESTKLRDARAKVLEAFFERGGTLLDSSPMYGSSEEVLGYCLQKTSNKTRFAATKTWTNSADEARQQLQDSMKHWGVSQFELLQIHNLLAWRQHLPWLRELQQAGMIRYLGITTSHGRRHEEVEEILKTQPIDFLQLTYNVIDTEAEQRLIPLAQDKGVAVISNRPFQGGNLTQHSMHAKVPDWAREIGCSNWPQLLLKYIISAQGVTVTIPATSKVEHMQENMHAMLGEMPDRKTRQLIQKAFLAI